MRRKRADRSSAEVGRIGTGHGVALPEIVLEDAVYSDPNESRTQVNVSGHTDGIVKLATIS